MSSNRSFRYDDEPRGARVTAPKSGTRPGPFVDRVYLVVDADADYRELVAHLLGRVGARALLAADMNEALAHLDRASVDMVLTDLTLPERDGYELLFAIRERWPELPVVAVTGYVARPRSAPSRHSRFDGFLLKPFDPTRLYTLLAGIERATEG